MGVGQPLSMKLKNVHLPHPHPNGGFSDSSLGRQLVLPVHIAALALRLSVVSTPAGLGVLEVPSEVVLLSLLGTSTCRERNAHSYCHYGKSIHH